MPTDQRIGFIGAGRMATALARGLIAARFAPPQQIAACDVSEEAAARFASETGARIAPGIDALAGESDVLVLAVKPQHMAAALADLAGRLRDAHLVVSIAAGVPIASIAEALGAKARIFRVMPNTPALVGAGASAFAPGETATAHDAELVERIFSTVGIAVRVPENLLDAVTGLSGSGPAYVFQMIEALADGGVRVGLPREVATRLAAQTVLGAARMVLETGEHPAVLKDTVASPGGTTIAGLHALEQGGVRGSLIDAVVAATARSRELGAPGRPAG